MEVEYKSRKKLQEALEGASAIIDDLSLQVLITTMTAHVRAGQVSIANAAKRCDMTEDNFARAMTVVDDQARKMLANETEATPAE